MQPLCLSLSSHFITTVGTKKECGERILLVNPSFCGPNDKNFQGVKKGKY